MKARVALGLGVIILITLSLVSKFFKAEGLRTYQLSGGKETIVGGLGQGEIDEESTALHRIQGDGRGDDLAFVSGIVIDDRGDFVFAVDEIRVMDLKSEDSVMVKVNGGRFDVQLAEGKYVFLVEQVNLPEGYLPQMPLSKFQRRGYQDVSGVYPPVVEVSGEEDVVEVAVALVKPSTVSVRFVDPFGNPVPGMQVRLSSFLAECDIRYDFETDEKGAVEFVGVRPGASYILRSWPITADLEHHQGLVGHSPIEVETFGGALTSIPLVVLGEGKASVRGQIIDQFGKPFSDLKVRVVSGRSHSNLGRRFLGHGVLATTYTDGAGFFSFSELPNEPLILNLTAGWDPTRPLGDRHEAFWYPPVPLDLTTATDSSVFDVGQHIVDRSNPFWANVRFEVGIGMRHEDYSIQLDFLNPNQEWDHVSSRRPEFERIADGAVPGSGLFSWGCETPLPTVQLKVTNRNGASKTLVIDPRPGETAEFSMTLDW